MTIMIEFAMAFCLVAVAYSLHKHKQWITYLENRITKLQEEEIEYIKKMIK